MFTFPSEHQSDKRIFLVGLEYGEVYSGGRQLGLPPTSLCSSLSVISNIKLLSVLREELQLTFRRKYFLRDSNYFVENINRRQVDTKTCCLLSLYDVILSLILQYRNFLKNEHFIDGSGIRAFWLVACRWITVQHQIGNMRIIDFLFSIRMELQCTNTHTRSTMYKSFTKFGNSTNNLF